MKLINFDGMAFIGPGSEWFWTAVSGLILAGTFVAIYRQLQMQRGAAAIEQVAALDRQWGSEQLTRARLAVLEALGQGVDPAKVPFAAASAILNFGEDVAYLVRAGHTGRDVVFESFGRFSIWWIWLSPFAVLNARPMTLEGAWDAVHD